MKKLLILNYHIQQETIKLGGVTKLQKMVGQPQRAIWMTAGYKVKRGSVSTVPSDDNKVTFTLLNERPFEKIGIQNSSSSPYVLEKGIFKIACDDAKKMKIKK